MLNNSSVSTMSTLSSVLNFFLATTFTMPPKSHNVNKSR